MRILIADDEPNIRDVLTFAFEQAGYEVDEAGRGDDALAMANANAYDAVLLDIVMPGLEGFDVCRELRRADNMVPVLFLTSRTDEIDRVLGLELGADDYVTKPFSPREVVARVKAILRRVNATATPLATSKDDAIEVGRLRIDVERRRVYFDGDEVELTKTEYGLLHALARRPRKIFTRAELMRTAYDELTHVSDRTIDSHVRHVREKFRDFGVQPIETVHGVGYSLGDL
jgi:two-component system OmpR family response regulator